MENDWPAFSDTRPVVAFVVICAALSCCCLLSGSTALVSRWWISRAIPPTPLPASPPGTRFELAGQHRKYASDPCLVSLLKKDTLEATGLDLHRHPPASHPKDIALLLPGR